MLGLDGVYQHRIYEPGTIIDNVNSTVNETYYAIVHLGTVLVKEQFSRV